MTYRPENYGARCSECVLRTRNLGGPIKPEEHENPTAVVVTDYPSDQDVDLQRMLVGTAGQIFTKHTTMHALKRPAFNYTAALLCRPPGGDLDKVRRKIKKANKQREAKGLPLYEDPVACCRPRLLHDLKASPHVMPLGSLALEAVLGKKESAQKYRGAPMEHRLMSGTTLQVVPLLHPSFVNAMKRWMRAFHVDIKRAVNWFHGETGWSDPKVTYTPAPEHVERFLQENRKISHDWETERKGQLRARPYCLGIGNGHEVLVIPFLSIDGKTRFYSDADLERICKAIAAAMDNPGITWVGHNSRVFDNVVSKRVFGTVPKRHVDTIMAHRSVEPGHLHKLEYVGSVWTEISRPWKATKTATEAKSDHELHEYCALDVVITYRIEAPLVEAVIVRDQKHVFQKDLKLQDACVGMHVNGLVVDMKRRNEWDLKLRKRIAESRSSIRSLLESELTPERAAKFNPRSAPQVADLLYERWKLPVLATSEKTGEPSTDEDAILGLRLEAGLSKKQVQVLDQLRICRRAMSARGTRIARLRQGDKVVPDEDMLLELDEKERKAFDESDEEKEPLLHEDGRFHPSWMPHATPTGRFGAQLVQNWPEKMRDIFIAPPGQVIVGLDADQGELRGSTNLSGAKLYVDCFAQGGDPHTLSALMVGGEEARRLYEKARAKYSSDKEARKEDPDWSSFCGFSKNFVFGSQYKAYTKTLWSTLRAAEDDEDRLQYPDLKLATVEERHKNLLKALPEWQRWWDADLAEYRLQGYLLSPYWGRKHDFLDGEDENQLANYKCQCFQGFTRVVTKSGLRQIQALSGTQFEAWTGKQWAPATAFQKDTVQILKVRLDRGVEFECDATHKVLVAEESGFVWASVQDAVGKTVALDMARPIEMGATELEEDAYWLGMWYADGSVQVRNENCDADLRWSISDAKGTVQKRGGEVALARLKAWAATHDLVVRTYKQPGATSAYITRGGRTWLGSWGVSMDERSHTKRIPERVWRSCLAARKAFLRGYLDGDGCFLTRLKRVQVTCCQRDLLQDVWLLARSVGINGTNLTGPYCPDGKNVSWRLDMPAKHCWNELGWGEDGHRLYLYEQAPSWLSRQMLPYLSRQGSTWQATRDRIERRGGTTNPYQLVAMGAPWMYDFAVLESVTPTGRTEPVYTLSVDDPEHQYVGCGVVAKNSVIADVVNEGTLEFVQRVPFKGKYGEGLFLQVHDAIYAYAYLEYAEEVMQIMRECLTRRVPGHPIPYTFSGHIGIKKDKKTGALLDQFSRLIYAR